MGLKPRTAHRKTREVDAWIHQRGDQAPLISAVRDVILAADSRLSECIKWSCPTFTFEGNLVSINPQAKKFVSLMFHTGGAIPGSFPQLTGTGATCKYMRIDDVADLHRKRGDLEAVARAWCAWKSK